MTCAEFKELAGAFALDALEPEERAAAEAHLLELHHEGCKEALQKARATAGRLASALDEPRVAERVWQRIEAGLAAPARRRPAWPASAGWAVAAALAVAAFLLLRDRNRLRDEAGALKAGAEQAAAAANRSADLAGRCARALDAARTGSASAREAIALLERPGARVVAFTGVGKAGQSAFAVLAPDGRRALLVSTTLLPAADRDYQLWVVPAAKGAAPAPAGLVASAANGVAVAEFDSRLLSAGAAALAVSAEPKGGSPTGKPTEVLLLAKPSG
ncbi:MAG TPA: anti-sigma factor [Myxococcales bacterium]|nr:anti-sigma factor [Myxococcales bacterium]